jgi:putative transposase
MARSFGRYGYKRITGLLQVAGWNINAKRVQRMWRAEGLKVPARQTKRGRLWLADGSCVRLRRSNSAMLSREWATRKRVRRRPLASTMTAWCSRAARSMPTMISSLPGRSSATLIGLPPYVDANPPGANHREHELRLSHARDLIHRRILDNGPEFMAKAVREWLAELGVQTLFIEPGSLWERGYIESFNSRLRDELLNGEIFSTLKEAQILIADRRRLYNGLRPHSSLGNRPPAPETIVWQGFALADWVLRLSRQSSHWDHHRKWTDEWVPASDRCAEWMRGRTLSAGGTSCHLS